MLRLRRYERLSVQNRRSLQRGPIDPKFQIEGVAPTNHSLSQKTKINVLSYCIKNLNISFCHFVTIHAFDGQTDIILIARPRLHSMQRGKNVRFFNPGLYTGGDCTRSCTTGVVPTLGSRHATITPEFLNTGMVIRRSIYILSFNVP